MIIVMHLQEFRCFKGTYSLQIKDYAKPYQMLPRCVGYAQELFKKELEGLQEQQMLVLLGVDEKAE